MDIYTFREGTTEPIDIRIDVTPEQSSEGVAELALEIVGQGGYEPESPLDIAWLDQEDWTVRITGHGVLTAHHSPYKVRVRLTDEAEDVSFVPTGKYPFTFQVVKP